MIFTKDERYLRSDITGAGGKTPRASLTKFLALLMMMFLSVVSYSTILASAEKRQLPSGIGVMWSPFLRSLTVCLSGCPRLAEN